MLWGGLMALGAGCEPNRCGRIGERCCASKDAKVQCKLGAAGFAQCNQSNLCCMVSKTVDATATQAAGAAAQSAWNLDKRGSAAGCLTDAHCCEKTATCQKATVGTLQVGFCCVAAGKACTDSSSCCDPSYECAADGTGASAGKVCRPRADRPDVSNPTPDACVSSGGSCGSGSRNCCEGLICGSDKKCVSCGRSGEVCCDGSPACADGLSCSSNRCVSDERSPEPERPVIGEDLPRLEIPDRLKPCDQSTDALECTNLHRCGWCAGGSAAPSSSSSTAPPQGPDSAPASASTSTQGKCMEGGVAGSTDGSCNDSRWKYLPADIGNDDCNAQTTCGACVRANPCGWCAGSGKCVRGTSRGADDASISGCQVATPDKFSCNPETDEWMYTTYECDLNQGKTVAP